MAVLLAAERAVRAFRADRRRKFSKRCSLNRMNPGRARLTAQIKG
jgi:hypothetical protein